jgi:malonate transporter
MQTSVLPLFITIIGKFIIFTLVVVLLARHFVMSELETTIALLFAAAPTASSAYTLAQQMGDDASLMPANKTIQKAFAFLALPHMYRHLLRLNRCVLKSECQRLK